MSQIGDLVRTLLTQPQRVDPQTANAMLERARAEGISPAELQELTRLLESELGDKFSPQLRESLTRFVEGGGATSAKPVHELLPDLELVTTADDVPKRFAADLVLLRGQLINVPKLPAAEKSERLFEFLLAYAERFVALASGEAKVAQPRPPTEVLAGGLLGSEAKAAAQAAEAQQARAQAVKVQPLTKQERERQLQAFAKALAEGGFETLRDPRTGRDGVKVVLHLLASSSVAELQRRSDAVQLVSPHFDQLEQAERLADVNAAVARTTSTAVRAAGARELGESAAAKERPRSELERVNAAKPDAMRVQPWQAEAGKVLVLPVQKEATREARPDPAERPQRGTNKVLGRNMLWNWLHTYREGGESEDERRHNLERLTFGAIVLLVGVALLAILLVNLG